MKYKLVSEMTAAPVTETMRKGIPSREIAKKMLVDMVGAMLTKYPAAKVNKTDNSTSFIFPEFTVRVAICPDPDPEPVDVTPDELAARE